LILLDTSGFLAALNPDEPEHAAAADALSDEEPPYLLSPFVLAELDYLLNRRARTPDQELALLAEVAARAYELASFGAEDVARAAAVIRQYRDLRIGLTDASIVVLAERYGTDRVLTLDRRDFRALRLKRGRPFVVLPAG
jgi:uncharacterized protein